jgi:hypothetical protein
MLFLQNAKDLGSRIIRILVARMVYNKVEKKFTGFYLPK